MKKFILLFIGFSLIQIFTFSQNAYITSSLTEKIENSKKDTKIPVLIVLNQQLNYSEIKTEFNEQNLTASERASIVLQKLHNQQNNFQKKFVNQLKTNSNDIQILHEYWIVNMILVETNQNGIEFFANNPKVRYLEYADNKISLVEPEINEKINLGQEKNNTEIGLYAINAPAMWQLGYTGRGRIVYNFDTGVCPDHPAIDEGYLGNYMPQEQCWYPYFSDIPAESASNHGTHTLGTMIGLDEETNDTIGVAFNAYWIANDLVTSTVEELPSISDMVLAFEWALDPDGNPETTSDMPDVINNSWRWYDGDDNQYCDGFVVDMLSAIELAGIANIFSGGNSGPNNISVNSPQRAKINLVNSFCVGAVDGNTADLPITSFSTRGPSQCTDLTPLNIHPEVVAPGYNVRSCVGENSYSNKSGTSMSCPHVSGAVLLLKEAFPDLTGEEILLSLYNSAHDLGDPGEDNTYGKGIIDVYDAFLYLSQTYTPTSPAYEYDIAITDISIQNCVNNISPIVSVKNLGTENINNFNLLFEVDGIIVQTYTHTSELTAGNTIELTLNSYQLPEYGNFKIRFKLELDESMQEIDIFNNIKFADHIYLDLTEELNESFEAGTLPDCWNIQSEAGFDEWTFENTIFEPHSGEHYAFIQKNGVGDQIAKLVTHSLDLSSYSSPTLKFWLMQKSAFQFQDILKVYYKNSYDGNWTLLQEYNTEIEDWTEQTIVLPETSNDYYVAFEGTLLNGQGICIDDITITDNTGIEEFNNNYNIYPNPTNGFLYIQNSNLLNEEININLFNVHGQNVYSETVILTNSHLIDISYLKQGIYYLEIKNNNSGLVRKIIIEK